MGVDRLIAEVAAALPPRAGEKRVVALCYHTVTADCAGERDRWAVRRGAFEAHLAAAADAALPFLTPGDLAPGAGPGVLVTFDDNLPSHVLEALPALREAGATATFFLNPAELGSPGRLDRRDVDRLVGAGMAVGAHNNRHVVAAFQDPDEFAREVAACRAFLEELGMPLAWAYPGGHPGSFGPAHEAVLREHGFASRFTTLERPVEPGADRPQGRYVVRRDSSVRYVRAALAGGLGLVRAAKRIRARVTPHHGRG